MRVATLNESGLVTDVRLTEEGASGVSIPWYAGAGWSFVDGVWLNLDGVLATPDQLRRTWTAREFWRGRLNETERAMMLSGLGVDALMTALLMELAIAQEVVSDDASTVAGLDALIAAGHMTAERKAEILLGP